MARATLASSHRPQQTRCWWTATAQSKFNSRASLLRATKELKTGHLHKKAPKMANQAPTTDKSTVASFLAAVPTDNLDTRRTAQFRMIITNWITVCRLVMSLEALLVMIKTSIPKSRSSWTSIAPSKSFRRNRIATTWGQGQRPSSRFRQAACRSKELQMVAGCRLQLKTTDLLAHTARYTATEIKYNIHKCKAAREYRPNEALPIHKAQQN